MAEKVILDIEKVTFPQVNNGELVITGSELLLYKAGFLFSQRSLIRRWPKASIKSVQWIEKTKMKLEGTKEGGEPFTETMSFKKKAEGEKVFSHLQSLISEQEQKRKEELKKEEEIQREKEKKERLELYRRFIGENLTGLWKINKYVYQLYGAIPQAEWNIIKEISNSLEGEVEAFFKVNGLNRAKNIPDFKMVAQTEEVSELEKGGVSLMEFLVRFFGEEAPTAAGKLSVEENMPGWEELKYFFLYTALLGEIGLMSGLSEAAAVAETASRLNNVAPIIERKFGFIKDKTSLASLKLPQKCDEALDIHQRLVAEVESYLEEHWGESA